MKIKKIFARLGIRPAKERKFLPRNKLSLLFNYRMSDNRISRLHRDKNNSRDAVLQSSPAGRHASHEPERNVNETHTGYG